MQANRTAPVVHGPYELRLELVTGHLTIKRKDADDRRRTVAIVDGMAQWDRFVAALEAGADEVAAVRAIDSTQRSEAL